MPAQRFARFQMFQPDPYRFAGPQRACLIHEALAADEDDIRGRVQQRSERVRVPFSLAGSALYKGKAVFSCTKAAYCTVSTVGSFLLRITEPTVDTVQCEHACHCHVSRVQFMLRAPEFISTLVISEGNICLYVVLSYVGTTILH